MSQFEKNYPIEYDPRIPNIAPTFEEITKQMKTTAETIMKEITEHTDNEIKRFQFTLGDLLQDLKFYELEKEKKNEKNTSKIASKKSKKNDIQIQ